MGFRRVKIIEVCVRDGRDHRLKENRLSQADRRMINHRQVEGCHQLLGGLKNDIIIIFFLM